MRTTRKGGPPQHSEAETDYDSYYDDEDEDELEAEALLSKKYGEASEAKSGTKAEQKKRGTTDQDIADEYAEQDKERKKKARRRVSQTITPDHLIKPKGLAVVRNGFVSRFHNGNGKAKYTNTTKSMAKFSRRLVSAYSDWVENMTGGLTLHETQWKLRSLGSKTQIKQYLGDMRKAVRDEHVERLLGLEKAERLLRQLDDYYNEEQNQHMEDVEDYDENHDNVNRETDNDGRESTDPSSPVVTNPYSNNKNNTRSTDARAPSVAITPTSATNKENNDPEGDKIIQEKQQEEDPLQRRLRLQKEHRARRHVLEDSDDEEAVFDDVMTAKPAESSPSIEANKDNDPITKVARRHVLDDSDDSDDENDGDKRVETVETSDNDIQNMQETDTLGENDKSSNTDDEFMVGSNVATTQTTTNIDKLDEKFERVKNLLERGGKSNKPATEMNEETGKTTKASSIDSQMNELGAVETDSNHDREDNPAPAQANIDIENLQKDELPIFEVNNNKSGDDL